MVQLLLRLATTPERRHEAVQALRAIMLAARLERGQVHTHLGYVVGDEEGEVTYLEEWPTVEELNQQIRSPRFGQLLALMETMPKPPRLEFRFVSEVRGLDYVAEVRGEPRITESI